MTLWWRSMKLTTKDAEFMTKLRKLLDQKDLSIEFQEKGLKRLILRKNYGDHIEREYGMTRQGVRWRFERLFNRIYPEAYMILLFIESHFGTEMREKAMAIARQRVELQREALARQDRAFQKHENGHHKD